MPQRRCEEVAQVALVVRLWLNGILCAPWLDFGVGVDAVGDLHRFAWNLKLQAPSLKSRPGPIPRGSFEGFLHKSLFVLSTKKCGPLKGTLEALGVSTLRNEWEPPTSRWYTVVARSAGTARCLVSTNAVQYRYLQSLGIAAILLGTQDNFVAPS